MSLLVEVDDTAEVGVHSAFVICGYQGAVVTLPSPFRENPFR